MLMCFPYTFENYFLIKRSPVKKKKYFSKRVGEKQLCLYGTGFAFSEPGISANWRIVARTGCASAQNLAHRTSSINEGGYHFHCLTSFSFTI